MKTFKILFLTIISLLTLSCSEDVMDEINKEKNNALSMSSQSMIPDIELRSAFETGATDIAWYASVYIEHNAGTWAQSYDQDRRVGQTAGTLFNNNWVSGYSILETCKDIIQKTGPEGDETNGFARGIAQVLSAYNLAMLTDMWGEVPWTEALEGSENLQPVFDKQSAVYPEVIRLLDEGIASFQGATNISGVGDYIYDGDEEKWIKAAYALKARFSLRLTNVDNQASTKALAAVANAFEGAGDAMIFDVYEASAIGENPWYQFLNDRSHLSISQTLFNLMDDRNDPRIAVYFTQIDTSSDPNVEKLAYVPAPSGQATQTQGGIYSISLITEEGRTAATPIMTYHELKFIEAEAKFRTSDATWQAALQAAVEASFVYHGLTLAEGTAYFTTEVVPLLTAGNEIKEILTQKYIAEFEYEAIEAYNDYRRVPSFITLNNPNNLTANAGFVWRFPYPTSETASNSAHVPSISVFQNKVWWAGGTEN